jgi:hypothetical protein
MDKRRSISITIEIIVSLFIILFLYTALSKIFKYDDFVKQLGMSPFFRPLGDAKYWLAVIVPLAEIGISILLMIPKTRLLGFYSAFVIMLAFTGYVIAILTIAAYVPCSCGGVIRQLSWTQHLILNTAFVLLAGTGIYILKYSNYHPVTSTATSH